MEKMDFGSLLLVLIAFGIISLALAAIIFRWIFLVKRQLWNQKQMVKLLCIIAKRLGENPDQYISEVERKTEVSDQFL